MLSNLIVANKIVGVNQVKRAIKSCQVEVVFIAKDADEKIINEIEEACTNNSIELILVDNMKVLGNACGIDVSAATAALLK